MDADELASTIESVKVMRLQPMDVVVFRVHQYITAETAEHIRNHLSKQLGHGVDGIKVLIIDGGCEIEVIRKEA